ncbi:MAG TPA: GTPase RsgA, partial [Microthrixaceae bacterium]|nr:GTPase RsgA [Microthrixaceae bacterium]
MTADDATPRREPQGLDALRRLGWNDDVARRWSDAVPDELDGLQPGRVTRTDRGEVDVGTGSGEVRATMTTAASDTVAGDWVALAIDEARVEHVVERHSAFVRRAARGAKRPQTLAANMDVVAAVASCEPGVNPRRLEREVVLAYQSRARPLVVVTKSDLVDDPRLAADIARNSAPGVDVVMVSNRSGEGIDELRSL